MNYKEVAESLRAGKNVTFRPTGNSMTPLIHSKDEVVVIPIAAIGGVENVEKGDILLSKVRGNYYLHKAVALTASQVLIGNNHGHNNGWANRDAVSGIVYSVQGVVQGPVEKRVAAQSLPNDKVPLVI